MKRIEDNLDKISIEQLDIDYSDAPDFANSYISKATLFGVELTDEEYDYIHDHQGEWVHEQVLEWAYASV